MSRWFLMFCAFLVLGSPASHSADAADAVGVSDAYVRAVPPGQSNGAVFMELFNGSETSHVLVGAESPVAEAVELHAHRMEGGMMRMRRLERINLPPGATVSFAPGGLHVMLIGLHRSLQPGEQVELTLIFADGSRARIEVEVRHTEP